LGMLRSKQLLELHQTLFPHPIYGKKRSGYARLYWMLVGSVRSRSGCYKRVAYANSSRPAGTYNFQSISAVAEKKRSSHAATRLQHMCIRMYTLSVGYIITSTYTYLHTYLGPYSLSSFNDFSSSWNHRKVPTRCTRILPVNQTRKL